MGSRSHTHQSHFTRDLPTRICPQVNSRFFLMPAFVGDPRGQRRVGEEGSQSLRRQDGMHHAQDRDLPWLRTRHHAALGGRQAPGGSRSQARPDIHEHQVMSQFSGFRCIMHVLQQRGRDDVPGPERDVEAVKLSQVQRCESREVVSGPEICEALVARYQSTSSPAPGMGNSATRRSSTPSRCSTRSSSSVPAALSLRGTACALDILAESSCLSLPHFPRGKCVACLSGATNSASPGSLPL